MSYYFKSTQRVIDGVKYSVSMSEDEVAYHVHIMKDGVKTDLFIQCKDASTCLHFRNRGEYGMLLTAELAADAFYVYKAIADNLLAR